MPKRYKMSKSSNRKNFSRGNGVKTKNFAPNPMRGGIRL